MPGLQVFKLRNTSIENLGEVSNPSPLTILFLGGNKLKTVPEWFSKLVYLEGLDLSGNLLNEVPVQIQKMKGLRRLVLDRNEIEILPDFLKDLKNLNHLSLDGNNFSEKEKARIGREFGLWF